MNTHRESTSSDSGTLNERSTDGLKDRIQHTELNLLIFFKESRGTILLSRKAKKINKFYDQVEGIEKSQEGRSTTVPTHRFKVPADEARSSVLHMLHLSITTPFKLLVTESVVFWFSLWASFAWGIFYALYNVVPLVFETNHKFDLEQRGAVFASIIIDKFARRYYPHIFDEPEGRFYFACVEATFLPIGLFWFGWTSSPNIHWIVPVIGLGVAEMGIFSIYLAVFNYLADTYHRLASSAIACTSFCRNVLGGVFPLFTPIMFTKLGYPVACSLLGGIATLLTAYPFILAWKGKAIRARSKIASEKMGGH